MFIGLQVEGASLPLRPPWPFSVPSVANLRVSWLTAPSHAPAKLPRFPLTSPTAWLNSNSQKTYGPAASLLEPPSHSKSRFTLGRKDNGHRRLQTRSVP